jgi:hypothetical protein
MRVSEMWPEHRRGPHRRMIAQGLRLLGKHGPEPRSDERRAPPWAATVALLSETFPQGQGVPRMEAFDPVRDRLARHVQALGHCRETFALIKPEQGQSTAEFLGLMRMCSQCLP